MGLRTYEFPEDLQELTEIMKGKRIVAARVRMVEMDIAIEGSSELTQLTRLCPDDQIFITAFLRSHGSIKEMERIFGVSYATIKSRPIRIANALEFVETNPLLRSPRSSSACSEEISPRKMPSAK